MIPVFLRNKAPSIQGMLHCINWPCVNRVWIESTSNALQCRKHEAGLPKRVHHHSSPCGVIHKLKTAEAYSALTKPPLSPRRAVTRISSSSLFCTVLLYSFRASLRCGYFSIVLTGRQFNRGKVYTRCQWQKAPSLTNGQSPVSQLSSRIR